MATKPKASKKIDLEKVLDLAKKEVKTESYPMSIGELVGMYEKNEIILRPQYQRYFRWTNEQKSKLIESVLIGLPLPSFFMAQDEKGNWEVVDGMQRLSTILDFMGVLKDEHKAQSGYSKFNKLSDDLFYLNAYAAKGWDDLSRRIQLDFRRTKIQLTILMRETNLDAKFELFMRLNSGGTSISGQELRNAILAGEDPAILEWLENLASDEYFRKVTGLAPSDIATRYDMELVLRFIAFLSHYKDEYNKFSSVDVFLTHVLREIIKDPLFNPKKEKERFQKTFKKIHTVWGDNALKYKTSPGTGKFSIAFFEVVALGIAQNISKLPADTALKNKINSVGKHAQFQLLSGGGKNANYRIPRLLELGKQHFKG
jgi:hypothetical protein